MYTLKFLSFCSTIFYKKKTVIFGNLVNMNNITQKKNANLKNFIEENNVYVEK